VNAYLVVKSLHILSATVLFGTGLGIAFFCLLGLRDQSLAARLFATRTTVIADTIFTAPAALLQPLTGAWLVWKSGFAWSDLWLVATYFLYVVAGLCWLPVVAIQIKLRDLAIREAAGGMVDQASLRRLFRWWFALGWPAFIGLLVIFFLMVAKPSW